MILLLLSPLLRFSVWVSGFSWIVVAINLSIVLSVSFIWLEKVLFSFVVYLMTPAAYKYPFGLMRLSLQILCIDAVLDLVSLLRILYPLCVVGFQPLTPRG